MLLVFFHVLEDCIPSFIFNNFETNLNGARSAGRSLSVKSHDAPLEFLHAKLSQRRRSCRCRSRPQFCRGEYVKHRLQERFCFAMYHDISWNLKLFPVDHRRCCSRSLQKSFMPSTFHPTAYIFRASDSCWYCPAGPRAIYKRPEATHCSIVRI
jgi:hypothetical protein